MIPSKLETLTAMASELAMSAVHNGRFHHATASWALEEQLASRRCLTNPTSRKLSTRFDSRSSLTRRLSSTPSLKNFAYVRSFSDFTEELSKVGSSFSACRASGSTHTADCASGSTHTTDCTPPGNVLSSQSDNSSDGDDDDDDYAESVVSECQEENAAGEWAAALVAVADQSLDNIGRDRSISESSSSDGSLTALSKSPVGFWYVRPGTSLIRCESEDDDDEPICWTASVESTRNPDDSESPLGSSGFIGDTHVFSPSRNFVSSNLGKVLAESSLVECTPTPTTIENPSYSSDDEFRPLPIDDLLATNGKISYKPFKNTGMNRSMSYSAFITHNSVPTPETSMSSKLNRSTSMAPTQTGDLFRTYFIKFVDLLVQRETEHLVHNKALLLKS